jgi:hypothetical protein
MIRVARTVRRPVSAAAAPTTLRFRVADWAAATSGRSDKRDWAGWARGELPRSDGTWPSAALPASLRRRITPIGQMAFRAAQAIGARTQARFIFCSRHGEFRRTKALLETLARREEPSPAEFSLAVHNALAGILSIERKNDAGHTAIAAGADSFGFGLVEAAVCLRTKPGEPILLVYFDEGLVEEYAELREGQETALAVALLLAAGQCDGEDLLLSYAARPRGAPARPATDQALDFLRFLLSNESERTSSGGSIEWRWHRDAG